MDNLTLPVLTPEQIRAVVAKTDVGNELQALRTENAQYKLDVGELSANIESLANRIYKLTDALCVVINNSWED